MPISLEEVARLQADLESGADRGATLREAALSEDAFRAAKLDWLEKIASDLTDGDGTLVQRYSAAFVARAGVRVEPARAQVVEPPPPPPQANATSAPRAVSNFMAAAREVLVPSFMATPAAPAQPAPPMPPAPMAAAPHTGVPARMPEAASLAGTGFLDREKMMSGLKLPFRENAAAPAKAPLAGPPAPPAPSPSSRTNTPASSGSSGASSPSPPAQAPIVLGAPRAPAPAIGAMTGAISREEMFRAVTPFLDKSGAQPAPPQRPPQAAPPSRPENARPPTPFQPPAPGAAPPPTNKPAEPRIDTGTAAVSGNELERVMEALRERERAGIPLSSRAPQAAPPPVAPVAPQHAPHARGPMPPTTFLPDTPSALLMPLTEYARITALLTQENDPPSTFRRLGVDGNAWMSVVRQYAQKFREDPALERTFHSLVAQFSNRRP